ncbi:SGNH hydrolase domain-containing protein [uncultured Rothia sp.]|uniref:SGNH hydrolase domain-containing protein n=1 Tax=uncultured Rothia sp. TaxID=316088 RepID=UPI0032168639
MSENAGETVPSGLSAYAEHLNQEGIGLITLRDNPRFEESHADCETRSKGMCSFTSELAKSANPLLDMNLPDNVATVDMTDVICPDRQCPSEIGNVYVYRDDSHLTRTFVKSAQEILISRFEQDLVQRDGKTHS